MFRVKKNHWMITYYFLRSVNKWWYLYLPSKNDILTLYASLHNYLMLKSNNKKNILLENKYNLCTYIIHASGLVYFYIKIVKDSLYEYVIPSAPRIQLLLILWFITIFSSVKINFRFLTAGEHFPSSIGIHIC